MLKANEGNTGLSIGCICEIPEGNPRADIDCADRPMSSDERPIPRLIIQIWDCENIHAN